MTNLKNLMYRLPSEPDIAEVTISAPVVSGETAPIITRRVLEEAT